MTNWQIKGCGHCGGAVRIEEDEYGWRKVCVVCGQEGLPSLTEDEEEQVVKRRRVKYGKFLKDGHC